MKCVPVIMAMKERSAYVDDIVERLDAPPIVVWDEKRDRYDTGRRALLAGTAVEGASHVCVLQDDALPCRDLIASVEQAVEVIGNNPISLYYGHGTNGAHQRTNAMARSATVPGLLRFEGPWWGVAVVFPTKLIGRILASSDRPQSTPAYDKRLSRALQRMRVDTYYILPSLVDHRLDGPSMIEGREQADRHAHHFIGADASALDIDWKSLPVADGHRRPTAATRHAATAQTLATVPRLPRPSQVSEPTVSVAVMAHPKRKEMAEALGAELGVEVVYDRKDDRWDTGRRAWLACDPKASHALVVQDDAIPSPDLLEGLSKALEVVGDNPLGLYIGTVRPAANLMGAMVSHAQRTGASWVVGEGPLWGVGVCLPTHMVQPMLQWCDAHPEIAAYDRRMARYFASVGIACWYPFPSLVDHRQGPSLINPRASGARKARSFATSALDVDYTRLPFVTSDPYVTYVGAGSRRFYQCLSCTFYTPMAHSIRTHVREHARGTGTGRVASARRR